jgi:hypothetical protein
MREIANQQSHNNSPRHDNKHTDPNAKA